MDPKAIFDIVKGGGPDVIFLLLVLAGLMLTGQLRAKINVDSEAAGIERAHQAELAARDRQIADLVRLQERMQERVDREHQLFEGALTLIRTDLIPLLRDRRR